MRPQHTLRGPTDVDGIGLHTGQPVRVRLAPAAPDTGVVFCCGDVLTASTIRARYDRVTGTFLATTLGGDGWTVTTVEHLLAALLAEGVDNVQVTVWGGEVPVLDGSAAPWVAAVLGVGLEAQPVGRRTLVVQREVEVTASGGRWARLSPCVGGLELEARIEFAHPQIGTQSLAVRLENGTFREELAWARTFGFLEEVEQLRQAGLGRGGSLENAVVYDASGVLNPGGLRGPDEAVRHKLLDMLGDLALVGLRVEGRLEAVRPGHALNLALVQRLLTMPEAWSIREG